MNSPALYTQRTYFILCNAFYGLFLGTSLCSQWLGQVLVFCVLCCVVYMCVVFIVYLINNCIVYKCKLPNGIPNSACNLLP